jgi:Thioesterase-like superfamily
VSDAYYEPTGEHTFLASEHTVGPWSAGVQHMGPPSALIARAMQRCAPREGMALAKLTLDILGPVPRAEVTVTASVLRRGRTIELVGAELSADGVVAVRATGWRLLASDTSAVVAGAPPPMPPPEEGHPLPMPPGWVELGYLNSVEWSWVDGSWSEPGPATVWGRPRYDLVAGEPTEPLCRLLTVADSASGVSQRLDPTRWLFPNTDLTVHLHRQPYGDWAGIRANTTVGPGGVAVATSTLHDLNGPVGSGAQVLTVRTR